MDPTKAKLLSYREARQLKVRDLLAAGAPTTKPGALKRKPMASMTRREIKAVAPKPASELPYQRLMAEVRRRFAALVEQHVLSNLTEMVDLRADSAAARADSPDRFSQRFGQLEVDVGTLTQSSALENRLKEIAGGIQEHARGELERVTRTPTSTRFDQRAFVQENVSLIRKMTKAQINRLHEIVSSATAGQDSYADLRDQLIEDMGFTKARATLIARDQTLKLNGQATQQLHKEAGVTRYMWSTSHDERVRDDHVALDGQLFDYAKPPVVDKRSGRRANPGYDFQCRCVAVPYTDDLLYGDD